MKETIYIIIRNTNPSYTHQTARIELRDDGVCVWENSMGSGFKSLSEALQSNNYKNWKLSHIETSLKANYTFTK